MAACRGCVYPGAGARTEQTREGVSVAGKGHAAGHANTAPIADRGEKRMKRKKNQRETQRHRANAHPTWWNRKELNSIDQPNEVLCRERTLACPRDSEASSRVNYTVGSSVHDTVPREI